MTTITKPHPTLYFVCEKDPKHTAWGVYSKARTSRVTAAFSLGAIVLDHMNAITIAENLQKQNPGRHYSVQGARGSHNLPDKYTI